MVARSGLIRISRDDGSAITLAAIAQSVRRSKARTTSSLPAMAALGGELPYWRTPSGSEVDFIWTRARRAVGIEVKAAAQWRREFGGPLKSLIEDRVVQSGFGVYTGTVELKDSPLRVLPVKKFLTELARGNVLEA